MAAKKENAAEAFENTASKALENAVSETEKKETKADPYEEYVKIELFKDGGRYKDDVFVGVNGDTCLIKRGEPVKIKRKFFEALKLSHEAEIRINEEQARLSEEFTKKQEALSE